MPCEAAQTELFLFAMKDNIDSSVVINRKIVIELRINPMATILDRIGAIADSIAKKNIFKPENFWEIGGSERRVQFRDNSKQDEARYSAVVEYNRVSFFCSRIDTVDSFFNQYKKFYDAIKEAIPEWVVIRIGCRIQGAYKTSQDDYVTLVEHLKTIFPNQFFLQDFAAKGFSFRVDYQSGMYQIAPLNSDDAFYTREFPLKVRNPRVGIMIDTDNCLVSQPEGPAIDSIEKIKSVLVASLAVEKALYGNLSVL